MKRIIVNTGKVGLVFRYGNYRKVLKEGTYWVRSIDKVFLYDQAKAFNAPINLNILLRDEILADMLTLVENNDDEITLVFENGNFSHILESGRFAFWKGVVDYSFQKIDTSINEVPDSFSRSLLKIPEFFKFYKVYQIESFEQGLLFINGKMERILETGVYYFWKNANLIEVKKVDLRHQQMEVSGQEIMTRDKAGLRISFFARYKVTDITRALQQNKEYEKQLYILMQLALREFIGTLTLDELLERKSAIAAFVRDALKESAEGLGVQVFDCGVRDIILPGDVREIMNQVLVAQKKAQANVITRREETASTRSLLNTAKLMEENEMLLRLKEMEYVDKIAEKISSISVSGGSQILDQMKDIFISSK